VFVTVPSAPRDFEVTLTQEDPPVATLTWRPPADLRGGELLGYRLTYGSLAADFVVADERLLDRDKLRFTTGFLGQSSICRNALRIHQAPFKNPDTNRSLFWPIVLQGNKAVLA